jgi:hypothetical protein
MSRLSASRSVGGQLHRQAELPLLPPLCLQRGRQHGNSLPRTSHSKALLTPLPAQVFAAAICILQFTLVTLHENPNHKHGIAKFLNGLRRVIAKRSRYFSLLT